MSSSQSVNELISESSKVPSNEEMIDRSDLVVAAALGVLFGDALIVVGLVGLGLIAFPFTWPVAVSVLVGAAIIAGIVYVVLHSSKAKEPESQEIAPLDDTGPPLDPSGGGEIEMDSIIPDENDAVVEEVFGDSVNIQPSPAPERSDWITERGNLFLKRAKEAEECFRGTGQIDDQALKYFVLALNVFYSLPCHLIVSQDKEFDEYKYCRKLENKEPKLYIRTVCIAPQEELFKGFRWVNGMLTGDRVCFEPHASVYLSLDGENWEYFDPKLIPLHDGLVEIGGGDKKVKSLVGGNVTEYKDRHENRSPPQVQPTLNPVDCGIHVCRRIKQYFEGTQENDLPVLTEEELRDLREEFASLIRIYVVELFERPEDWIQNEGDKEPKNDFRNQMLGLDKAAYDRAFLSSKKEPSSLS